MPAVTPQQSTLLAQHTEGDLSIRTSPFGHPLLGPVPWNVQEALRSGAGAPQTAAVLSWTRVAVSPGASLLSCRQSSGCTQGREGLGAAGEAGEGRMFKLMVSGGLAGAGAAPAQCFDCCWLPSPLHASIVCLQLRTVTE